MTEALKQAAYGMFQAGQDWQQKLKRAMTHKALDIADDDVNIDARKTNTGIGTLGAVGIAAVSGLLPGALAAYLALRPAVPPVTAPAGASPPVSAPGKVGDTEIEVKWWQDADGTIHHDVRQKEK